MKPGIKNEISLFVTQERSASAMGSGTLEVFATPAMVALMEQTAAESVESLLEEGNTTVGTMIQVNHLAATPMGMKVTCNSELVAVEGRKLTFKLEAFDEVGLIGTADHERFVVGADRFLEKVNAKIKK